MRVAALLGAVAVTLASAGACSDGGSTADLCTAVAAGDGFGTRFERGLDPTDQETALELLRSARVDLGRLHDTAPSAARDDLRIQVRYVDDLVEALEAAGDDDAEAVAAVQSVTDDHPDVQAAADRLEAWDDEHC